MTCPHGMPAVSSCVDCQMDGETLPPAIATGERRVMYRPIQNEKGPRTVLPVGGHDQHPLGGADDEHAT